MWEVAVVSGEIGGRARWPRLTAFLAARPPGEESTTLSWVEFGRIVGGVPDSAVRHYPQWWHGDRSHVRAWRAAGYVAGEIQPGRSVTFRRDRRAGPVGAPAGKQQQSVLLPSSSGAEVSALQGIDPRAVLLVIPCSKTKRQGGSAQSPSSAAWPSQLVTAREHHRLAAGLNEQRLMPAWRRYSGNFYTAADGALRDAVSDGAPLVILSGGYGLLHAVEPIGDYNKRMRLADWPSGLLEGLLVAEATVQNVPAVVAFAASSSDYARLVRRAPWPGSGVSAFLVTITGVSGGASGEVPRRLGRAFTCFWQRRPAADYPAGTTVERLV